MNCSFPNGDKGTACEVCGYKLVRRFGSPPSRTCPIPGVGDKIATALAVAGVTEARWLWLKSWFVEKPTCGCKARKEKLNKWGRLLRWAK